MLQGKYQQCSSVPLSETRKVEESTKQNMIQNVFHKKEKFDSTYMNAPNKNPSMKENKIQTFFKQTQQYPQKSAQFLQTINANDKEGVTFNKQESTRYKQYLEKQKYQTNSSKGRYSFYNLTPNQGFDSTVFRSSQSSSLALLARTKDETQFFSTMMNMQQNGQFKSGGKESKQKDVMQTIPAQGENTVKSKISVTNNSFSQEIFNIHKQHYQHNHENKKGFLFQNQQNSDYFAKNSSFVEKARLQGKVMQHEAENDNTNSTISKEKQDEKSYYNSSQQSIRNRRIYSKSLPKTYNTENDQEQDQSVLAQQDNLKKFKLNPAKKSGDFNAFKSGYSSQKYSSTRDFSNSNSTQVSFKKSLNMSQISQFPKIPVNLNLMDTDHVITKQIEKKEKPLNQQFRSVSLKRNLGDRGSNLPKQQIAHQSTQNSSFFNQSKDRTIDFSFAKVPNLFQYNNQHTDRQNEISIIEPDSNLFQNKELSPRDKNLIQSIDVKEQNVQDQSNKYLSKFIKLNPYLITQEEKLKKLKWLKVKQISLLNSIQKRNFEDAINVLKECLTLTSQSKNLENFAETISFLGQLHYYSHDLDNALYSFLQLKYLSEIIGNPQIKMKSLIHLGQLLQDEQDYDYALSMYRRAIHYSWYLNNTEVEIELLDKLGFLYFMKGDIQKAKYFHERSIGHQSENTNSENRQQSVYTVAKQYSTADKFIPTLNQMVLAKLGLVTDQQDQLRFSTKISAELQMIILKEDKEINFASHDPNEINPDDLIYSKVIPEGMENIKEYQIIQKILDQKNSFQPIAMRNTLYKDPSSQKIVDKKLLKLSLEEKVNKIKMDVYDNERLQKKLKEAQVSALINRQSKNEIQFYNHCSPNRNLLGFKYTFRPNVLKFKNYFNKMEEMIISSDN